MFLKLKMINEAIEVAVSTKDAALLVQIREQTQNKTLVDGIDQALAQLGYPRA